MSPEALVSLLFRLAVLGLVWALVQHLADVTLGQHFLAGGS